MCDLCDAMGLNWSDCAECGYEFIWKRWDVKSQGPFTEGIPAGTPAAEDAMESPSWINSLPPAKCVDCSPGGYVYPTPDPVSLAWMQGERRKSASRNARTARQRRGRTAGGRRR